jgi:RNA processing factor Prp31
MSQTKTSIEILGEQQKRLAQLSERRTRAQVRLENEKRALEEARAEAKRLFGTDDVEALRKLFRTSQDDNDRKVVEFVMALDDVEQKLGDIERQVGL